MSAATERYYQESKRGAQIRKDNFKKYIKDHSLMEKMNGAVTAMFHEPQLPDNPLEYISSQLCADKFQKADASIKRVEELEKEIKKLKSELRNVKAT